MATKLSLNRWIISEDKVLVLDGGFSNQLATHMKLDEFYKDPLWTAKALVTNRDAIFKTHLDFLNAGADIIETATYQATVKGYEKYMKISGEEAEGLIKESVVIAKNAINHFKSSSDAGNDRKTPLIAGSVGPYGAYLCDGSEYNGSYFQNNRISHEDLHDLHFSRIQSLVEAGVDLLAFETIPSVEEAEFLMELLKKYFPTTRAWVSFSVGGDPDNPRRCRTSKGESFPSVLGKLLTYSQLVGVGVNCCSPIEAERSLTELHYLIKNITHLPTKIIAYPNSGQEWESGVGWTGPANTHMDKIEDWINKGLVDMVGGCCQVGCKEISKIRSLVDARDVQKNLEIAKLAKRSSPSPSTSTSSDSSAN